MSCRKLKQVSVFCYSISAPRGFIVMIFCPPSAVPICWHDTWCMDFQTGFYRLWRAVAAPSPVPLRTHVWLDRRQDSQFVNVKDVFAIGSENWLFRLANVYPWSPNAIVSRIHNGGTALQPRLKSMTWQIWFGLLTKQQGDSIMPIIAYAKAIDFIAHCV